MDGLGPVLTAGGGVLMALLTVWGTVTQNRSKATGVHYRASTRRLALLRRVFSLLTGTPTFLAWPADLRESIEQEVLGE